MKIPKAIEILNDLTHHTGNLFTPDERDTIQLALEALELIQLGRTGVQRFAHIRLPSETLEGGR